MVCGDFKDLTGETASDKTLRDKAFNIAKNLKYNVYKRGFASMVYKLFDKYNFGNGTKNENISKKELAEELRKQINKKNKKKKSTLTFYRQ